MTFDYAADVAEHKKAVGSLLRFIVRDLEARAAVHDDSKLDPEEMSVYERVIPEIKTAPFGSDAYKAGLVSLGPALDRHYAINRHHPEHFGPSDGKPGGIPAMALSDIVEMLCDWVASAEAKGNDPVKGMVEFQFPKYGVDGDLQAILLNTVRELRNGR